MKVDIVDAKEETIASNSRDNKNSHDLHLWMRLWSGRLSVLYTGSRPLRLSSMLGTLLAHQVPQIVTYPHPVTQLSL